MVLPLVSLIVSRSGPFLEFKDVGEGNPKLWACLKFSSYERRSYIPPNQTVHPPNERTK